MEALQHIPYPYTRFAIDTKAVFVCLEPVTHTVQ